MTTVDVVAAVGREERDAVGAAAGEEQGQQLAGRLVGPVDVLDDDEQRGPAAEVGEGAVHGLDEVGAHGVAPGAGRDPRDERDEPGVLDDELVDEAALPGVEGAEELDEGEVRQARAALPHAVPHEGAPTPGAAEDVADEGGLADAGVTAEQDRPRAPVAPAQRLDDPVDLVRSADELGWGTGRHGPDHRTRRRTPWCGHG